MSWEKDNEIYACLWAFETWYCRKRGTAFDKVGNWKVEFIIRLGGGTSGDFSTDSAHAHAEMIDEWFQDILLASYVGDKTSQDAVNALVVVLSDSSKIVADLGPVMEENYVFT